ncbi:MAG: MotA/TolQ/ExbB proton channel family protein [Magnetococcales bacterium]|nr:MotA/TolQ/ExbB proton channel family protein [Magnetococcales bacterium]
MKIRISGIIGLALMMTMLYGTITVDGDLTTFFNLPSGIIVLVCGVFLGYSSFGWRRYNQALLALGILVSDRFWHLASRETAEVIRAMKGHFLACGFLGTQIGLVQMLASFDDPNTIGPAMAVALLAVLYAIFLAMFICQPALNRVEDIIAEHKPSHSTAQIDTPVVTQQ